MGLKICNLNLDHEKKQLFAHGTANFPCAAYQRLYLDRPEHVIPWHWHEELEIAYVVSGTLKFQIPAKNFLLTQGDCIIVNSNVLHGAVATPEYELQSLVFHPKLITGGNDSAFAIKYLSPLLAYTPFDGYVLKGEEHPFEISCFHQAFGALAQDIPGFEFTVRAALSQICYFMYQYFEPEVTKKTTEPNLDQIRIRNMLEYIQSHFSDPVTLSDIARAADIGEREALRCFKRNIQVSPMQYLLKYRVMQGADLLLQERGTSISQIALLCGFDSPSHFSKMFRRFYDCSPKGYRNASL